MTIPSCSAGATLQPARRPLRRGMRLLAPLAFTLICASPARALTIQATFEAGFDPVARTTVGKAIAIFESTFSDDITVNVQFVNVSSGLAMSATYLYTRTYEEYLAMLRADADSNHDTQALAHLPNSSAEPVTGRYEITTTRAAWGSVGVMIDPPAGQPDSTIGLNLALMNFTRASFDPLKYDLQTVVMHEIDEVLGTASGLGLGGEGRIEPMDLFRYSGIGTRSYTTLGDDAYFSLDGSGKLARFNQDSGGDYGDLWSTGPHAPIHVQDAFGTPGTFADLGVEITMLDVVGYTVAAAVPEPGAAALMLAGLAGLGSLAPRLRRR